MDSSKDIEFLPHHQQRPLCTTRAPYRQGRKLTAVKVYTVNDESIHLLIHGVPSIGLQTELLLLCERYGRVKNIKFVDKNSPDQEEFTDIFHVHFERIQAAKFAKKIMDGREFYGGILHVCYAPELETIHETKLKLVNRKKEIAKRTNNFNNDKPKLQRTSDSFDMNSDMRKVANQKFKVPSIALQPLVIDSTSVEASTSSQAFNQKLKVPSIALQPIVKDSTSVEASTSSQAFTYQNTESVDDRNKLAVSTKRKIITVSNAQNLSSLPKKFRPNNYSQSSASLPVELLNAQNVNPTEIRRPSNIGGKPPSGPFRFLPRSLSIKEKATSHNSKL